MLMRTMNDVKKYHYQAMKEGANVCSLWVSYEYFGVTIVLVGVSRVCLCYECACG